MSKDDHPEPDPRRPAVPTSESAGRLMANDNHLEPEPHGLSQQLQAAWTRVQQSADTFQRVAAGLPERLPRIPSRPNITMPAVPSLTWRDLMLFGCTGASIVLALITAAIVVSDMLARGTP
jgi:hypothetical protein